MATPSLVPVVRYIRKIASPPLPATLSDRELLARFAAERDETAFAALVRRHGAMVLGVCRRVLGDFHAAEDAFQATLMVLACKAGRLRRPELLRAWLHGVAARTAAKARADAARRRRHERRPPDTQVPDPADDVLRRDLRGVLDEEVSRLPARYRVAVVLCYLEGRTNAEAGRLLGCSRGTVATLLARARERLRRRLTSRGLAPVAGLTGAWLAQATCPANVPPTLALATVRAALVFAAGHKAALGAVSVHAASLAQGVIKTMMVSKVKVAAAVLLALALVGSGAGVATYRAGNGEPGSAPANTGSPTLARDAGDELLPPLPAPTVESAVVPPPALAPDAGASGKAACLTSNFEVTASNLDVARQVGRAAEGHRKALALLWLGKEIPPWSEPCAVNVKLRADGPASSTAFAFEKGRVLRQTMSLEGSLDEVLADLLPHEVTHTILAHKFGVGLPRWADEGAATLAESTVARKRQETAMLRILDKPGRRIPLRQLVALRDYPKDVVALYAQGYSLTAFLVESSGRERFLAFVAQGQREGWDRAVQAQYKYEAVEDLEKAWLAHIRKAYRQKPAPAGVEATAAPVAQPPRVVRPLPDRSRPAPGRPKAKGSLPLGPAPVQALVALGDDGRLTVWQASCHYEPRTTVDDRGVQVTSYYQVSGLRASHHALDEIRVYDTKGQSVDPRQLAKLLKGETPALVSQDGRPVDPLHLRLTKEGTLLFVLPGLAAPPAPPVAPPATPPVPPASASRGYP
jgi:RNA polymerase sigma factor (sigma-70 family)